MGPLFQLLPRRRVLGDKFFFIENKEFIIKFSQERALERREKRRGEKSDWFAIRNFADCFHLYFALCRAGKF